jgi:hypothetical protein
MQQQSNCPNCNSVVDYGTKFCSNCGTQLNWPIPLNQPPQQQQYSYPQQNYRLAGSPYSFEAEGINGQLDLLEDTIRIRRKGVRSFLTQGLKGEKEILISQISAIQFKKAGLVTNGYIQFSFIGGLESKSGILGATMDENSVFFNKNQEPAFAAIREEVQRRISQFRQGTRPGSNINDLEQLASLRDRGIISEQEFNIKKRQILGI